MNTKSKPCPKCGGTDRYYYMPTAKFADDKPVWRCNQCNVWHLAEASDDDEALPEIKIFTDEQRKTIYKAYAATTAFCQELLWGKKGREALAFLRGRGFSDDTIREAHLGFHPAPNKRGESLISSHLSNLAQELFQAAKWGGLINPQNGRMSRILKKAIIIPYIANETVTLLRSRSLDDKESAKYLSPACTLYAGGEPVFYLDRLLKDHQKLILTEGEFKALLPTQAWEALEISMPAIGTPGIQYMPDAFLDRLAGKTIYLIYDTEARKNPFKLSPGERFSLKNGRKLMGLDISGQIGILEKQLEQAAKKRLHQEMDRLEKELEPLRVALAKATARKIDVKIARLPRLPHETKVDLDGFLLKHGSQFVQALITEAQDFREWAWAHGKQGFSFKNRGIYKGSKQLANFQAVITANIMETDGYEETGFHRFILRTPSMRQVEVEIPASTWAKDTNGALAALRVKMFEGTARDEGKMTLDAIKQLSQWGDDPLQIVTYGVTGWQNIYSKWHYLVPDGAINADGATPLYRANIKKDNGLHHKLLVDGLPAKGWDAFQMLLWGQVCPQPLALIMLSHAALALIHRWLDTSGRSGVWLYGESGVKKSALNRIVLALWGKDFTAVRSDGKPLAKWSGNYVGLELTAHAACDLLFSFDDYKEATARKGTLATFLHNYSESSSRARGRADLKMQRDFPSRGIALFSGESVPMSDTGQLGRLLPWQINQGDIDSDVLTEMQKNAVKGHYTAFWSKFIQHLAKTVDKLGEKRWKERLNDLALEDIEAFPAVHPRVVDALRQNKMGWQILTEWLYEARYINDEQLRALHNAYYDARHTIAKQQTNLMQQERPADKVLNILSEMIATGDLILEGDPIPGYGPEPTKGACPSCGQEEGDIFYLIRQCRELENQPGWHCVACKEFWLADAEDIKRADGYPIKANPQVIGFYISGYKNEGVALYPETIFTLVQRALNSRGERLQYRSHDIWSQMMNQGYLTRTGNEPGRAEWLVRVRHPLTKAYPRVLLVKPCKLLMSQLEEEEE